MSVSISDQWKTIAITLGIFIGGLAAGALLRSPSGPVKFLHRAADPGASWAAPLPMGEFGEPDVLTHVPPPGVRPFNLPLPSRRDVNPALLREYEEKLDDLSAEYTGQLRALLNPEQQAQFDAMRDALRSSPPSFGIRTRTSFPPGAPPGGSVMLIRTNPGPGELRFVGMVIYRPILDHLAERLKLTGDQKAGADAILKKRRDALLKFVDENPPPTLLLMAGPPPPAP